MRSSALRWSCIPCVAVFDTLWLVTTPASGADPEGRVNLADKIELPSGGEQLKANALTLESYITDRWTKNHVNVVFFDNVVIARRYIGPVAKP